MISSVLNTSYYRERCPTRIRSKKIVGHSWAIPILIHSSVYCQIVSFHTCPLVDRRVRRNGPIFKCRTHEPGKYQNTALDSVCTRESTEVPGLQPNAGICFFSMFGSCTEKYNSDRHSVHQYFFLLLLARETRAVHTENHTPGVPHRRFGDFCKSNEFHESENGQNFETVENVEMAMMVMEAVMVMEEVMEAPT
eukprot:COSAG02_NODE_211_length_28730_cov_5.599490_8_plen_194_part_00